MSELNDSPRPRTGLATLAARKAGHSAIVIAVCVLIWAFTRHAGGSFWPGWIIFLAALDFLIKVGKAAFGDAKTREQTRDKLEKRYGDAQ
jgi:hypothetical protein